MVHSVCYFHCNINALAMECPIKESLMNVARTQMKSQYFVCMYNNQCCKCSGTYLFVGTGHFSCSRRRLSTKHQLPLSDATCSSHYLLSLLKHYLL